MFFIFLFQGPWGAHYFTDPRFSASFTNLDKKGLRRDVSSTRGSCQVENEKGKEEGEEHGIDVASGRTSPLSHNHHQQHQTITRSRTVAGTHCVENSGTLYPLHHSTSLRFSSPPENLDQFRSEGSSCNPKVCSIMVYDIPNDCIHNSKNEIEFQIMFLLSKMHDEYKVLIKHLVE